jgi:N-acetylglucosamine malate deacetylase 2
MLQTLARRPGSVVDGRFITVVVAHPDDETIGSGAMLRRMRGVHIALTTNGAPSRSQFWQPKGFASAKTYGDARWQGLKLALSMVDIPPEQIESFGATDQEASLSLFALTQWLKSRFIEHHTEIVLTHAYEGGHPDHDATAFAVHAAAQLIQRESGRKLTLVEMPFYRMGQFDLVVQDFERGVGGEIYDIELRDEEIELKRRMYAAHASQIETLERFGADTERFRVAANYDFGELPNGGDILYDSRDWAIKSRQWLQLSRTALQDLGLPHLTSVSTWENLTWPRTPPQWAGAHKFGLVRPSKPSYYERVRAGRWTFLH